MNHLYIGLCLFIVTVAGCKEIYKPDIISTNLTFLVVEGNLNAGGPTSIRLTRTYKLDDTAKIQGERNATVTVEGRNNLAGTLAMTADGIYTSANLNLIHNEDYRLRIRTVGGKEYLSDFVKLRRTPVIDSVGFRQNEDGVLVFVNSHDASNSTRYYRWDFDETWEIRAFYFSRYMYVNGAVVERTPADEVYNCWKYDHSKQITLASTASYAADVVRNAPVTFIPNGSERLSVRYSILLRQYALDKPAYEFFELMKKNTESLGTIFDAQPSELTGNIRCISDPGEQVVGYITASSVEEKRFFIGNRQLNNWRFYEDCPSSEIPNHPDSISVAYASGSSIYSAGLDLFNNIESYAIAYKNCVECTARGGSVQRPAYW